MDLMYGAYAWELSQQNQVWPLTNVSDPWRVGCVYRVGRFDTEPLQSIRPCGPVGHHLPRLTSVKERKTSLIFLSSVRPFSFFYRLAVEFISNFKLFQHSCFHAYFPYLTSHFTIQADQQHMFTLGLHSFAPAITNRFPLCSNDCTYIIAQGQRNVVNKTSKTKKNPHQSSIHQVAAGMGKM